MTVKLRTDPITFELVRHGLASIVDEMALTVVRTAYSHALKEVLDFATALCDPQGQLVAQGPSLPMHMGSMPDALSAVLKRFDGQIAPGDVYVLNDPYEGGMHLPDIFIFKPYFVGDHLLAFFAITAHHADVGGLVPSSMSIDATDVFQEGFRFPPLKLYDRGQPNETFLTLLERNTRLPERVFGDLRAQLAACHTGEVRLDELVAKHGAAELERQFAQLLDYSEALARAEIQAIPDGIYEFEDAVDDDGLDPGPIPLHVRLTVRGDEVEFDFSGSAAQVRGAINPTFSYVKSTAYATLRCLFESDIPNNSGYFRPVKIYAPLGSILNPKPPAACALRSQTTYRLADAIFGALAQAVPHKVFAAGEGGTTNIRMSGEDPEHGRFSYMDAIQGTWGGRPNQDGVDGVGNITANLSNTPAEVIEADYPLCLLRYSLVPDSGGPGKFRGGLSVTRELQLLADVGEVQVRSDRHKIRPYGLAGGGPGLGSSYMLTSQGQTREIPTKARFRINFGDAVQHVQAGGGGYGNPFERDLSSVQDDVRNEKVSIEAARRDYGVVIDPGSLAVDVVPTERLRAARRGARRSSTLGST